MFLKHQQNQSDTNCQHVLYACIYLFVCVHVCCIYIYAAVSFLLISNFMGLLSIKKKAKTIHFKQFSKHEYKLLFGS